MQVFVSWLRMRWKLWLLCLAWALIYTVICWLWGMPLAVSLYAFALCAFLGAAVMLSDFLRFRRKYRTFFQDVIMRKEDLPDGFYARLELLPRPDNVWEEAYQKWLGQLLERLKGLEADGERRYAELSDYYMMWAHQIKTPIAAMRLKLQSQDSQLCRELEMDLVRIEQYVEMVMCYLRLDSESTDYVLKEQELDPIVRQAVRQLAPQFIGKKLRLDYEPLDCRVLTDEKWLLFVIGQVLSNALKYTREGGISIVLEEPKTLCMKDTGIGIAPEDVPRIFEKGFTGFNGREDKKASGLGLYLCRRICSNLGHRIEVESVVGKGTSVRIFLEQKEVRTE